MSHSDDMLPAAAVEERLHLLGCYWGADMDDFHQVWITAWGHSFIVPMHGSARACPAVGLMDIAAEVRTLRPRA